MKDAPTTIDEVVKGFAGLNADDEAVFAACAALIESHQRTHCDVYRRFEGFRYLPVQAFKMAPVTCFGPEEAKRVFVSSGTSNQQRSRHYVADPDIYQRSVLAGYDRFVAQRFGWKTDEALILGHLPAYARESSLVAMVNILIEHRGANRSTLFLEDTRALAEAKQSDRPVLLFGAAFGLLDLIETGDWKLPRGSVVIETGGMKTHRRQVGREELHRRLSDGFSVGPDSVLSEYGMCELMSQCYTDEKGLFRTPPWMRFEILNPEDGITPVPDGERGVLALFDLANVHTVSAILTEDSASAHEGGFLIHGRLSKAELRGCNFLMESN